MTPFDRLDALPDAAFAMRFAVCLVAIGLGIGAYMAVSDFRRRADLSTLGPARGRVRG